MAYDYDKRDKRIWQQIVKDLCKRYDLFEEEFNRIIAFCYPLWGSRRFFKTEGVYRYKIKWRDILEIPNKRFVTLVERAVKTTRSKLAEIDTLWTRQRESASLETKYICSTPSTFDLNGYQYYLEGSEETEELDLNNLMYGAYTEEDQDEDT